MSPRSDVDDYFSAGAHPYWHWQDDGNVITWSDGTTIAFRAELVAVLERLRSQSLPPVGAVVLVLAACRDTWNEGAGKAGLLVDVLHDGKRTDRIELLNRVTGGLDRIRALNADLRGSLDGKAELAAVVFEGQGNALSTAAFDRLLEALRSGAADGYAVQGPKRNAVDWLLRDLAWLERGLGRVDETALRLRMKTGLEQPLVPAPVEVPALGTARSLIPQLKADPDLGGVARLAELLLAAVLMPRPLSLPEELPLGGVSDITNRGNLDRLLLSELANDDLTLAVRVAMNEALYLRRETPPRTPSRRRLVMLDAGIRTWGVPRVFVAAVGLALAAGTDSGVEVTVVRADGAELEPVDMTSAAGLTEHLSALDDRIHPGASLERLAAAAHEAGETTDIVIVTTDDVAADRTFQRALAETEFPESFLATVARDGTFELVRHTFRGRKILRQAQFDLEQVLAPPTKPTAPLVVKSPELPAVFHESEFPLLLSASVEPERSWHVRDFGVLTYARDGRLLHWTARNRGARQLAENLPAGGLHWAATHVSNERILAVIGKKRPGGFQALHIPTEGRPMVVPLDIEIAHPQYVFARGDTIFVGDQARVEAASATSGVRLGSAPTNEPAVGFHTHRHDGLFTHWNAERGGLEWTTASFDGTQVSLSTVVYGSYAMNPRVVGVFRVQGREPFLAVTNDGGILELENKRLLRKIGFHRVSSISVERQSRSGEKLLVAGRDGSTVNRRIIDLVNLGGKFVDVALQAKVDIAGREFDHLLEPELAAGARPWELRHKFHAIGVDAVGRLVLVGRRDKRWPFEIKIGSDAQLLFGPQGPVDSALKLHQTFELLDDLEPNPYSLSAARFRNGSRAVLDGRGLLHLKSSDPTLPEMTIVLNTGVTSGWATGGRCWGWEYFAGNRDQPIDRGVLDGFTRFIERLA